MNKVKVKNLAVEFKWQNIQNVYEVKKSTSATANCRNDFVHCRPNKHDLTYEI